MNAISLMTTDQGLGTAEVLARDEGALVISRDGQRIAARRALSCLVEPEPGDLVLLGGPASRPYVLAVLERAGAAPIRLTVEGNAELATLGGTLTLRAEALVMVADRGHVLVRELTVSGEKAEARFATLSLVAEAIESLATRLLTRAKRSFRFVEETEQLRAHDIDHRAAGHLNLRGQTAILQAGTLVKVDSKQIHMG